MTTWLNFLCFFKAFNVLHSWNIFTKYFSVDFTELTTIEKSTFLLFDIIWPDYRLIAGLLNVRNYILLRFRNLTLISEWKQPKAAYTDVPNTLMKLLETVNVKY